MGDWRRRRRRRRRSGNSIIYIRHVIRSLDEDGVRMEGREQERDR